MKMKQPAPFRANIKPTMKADLERFAAQDGIQRGLMFDTSGNLRSEHVSATATHTWLFKTKAGKPFNW